MSKKSREAAKSAASTILRMARAELLHLSKAIMEYILLTIRLEYVTLKVLIHENLFPAGALPGEGRRLKRAGRSFMKTTVKRTVLTLLFVTLSITTAFLIYLHFLAPGDKDLTGEWTAELVMTDRAAVTALGWLQEMEAVSISLEDMESYMQDLTIQVDLTLEQTGQSGGTFRCHIPPESYEACSQAAYEAFAAAFRELLAQRLRMAGYGDGTDADAVEALVEETFGMSTVSYLRACAPGLLPDLEELQAQYDGSGTYGTAEGILTRQFDDGRPVTAIEERYIRQGSSLVLSEETDSAGSVRFSEHYPMVYTLVH